MAKRSVRKAITRPRRRIGLGGAPVIYNQRNASSAFSVRSSGDNLLVTGRDLLGIATISTNTPGEQIFNLNVNPTELGGERLRRFASVFDAYNFTEVVIHFTSSLGTSVGGDLLGWFDMDPSDTVTANEAGLRVGSAHPGAAYTQDFKPCAWRMPKPLQGRYYMEGSKATASDKRLTQEAVFTLAVNSPIPTGSTLPSPSLPANIGSLWISYKCVLQKSTVQEAFVGGSDVYTIVPPVLVDLATNASVPLQPGKTNNTGTSVAIQNGYQGYLVPAGQWDVAVQYRQVTTAAIGTNAFLYSQPFLFIDGSATQVVVPGCEITTNVVADPVLYSRGVFTGYVIPGWNWGFRLNIPDDGSSYFLSWNTVAEPAAGNFTASITAGSSGSINFTRTFPTAVELPDVLSRGSTTMQLIRRLRALELRVDTSRDVKDYPEDSESHHSPLDDGWYDQSRSQRQPVRRLGAAAPPASPAGSTASLTPTKSLPTGR